MVRNRQDAVDAALRQRSNIVGTCQATVRDWLGAGSAGDFDGDGAADAEDGWKKEPAYARRTDRHPQYGYPVSFVGGRRDFGHRALALHDGKIRSTDFNTVTQRYDAGVVGTANSIEALERAMGVTYAGWSTTINGFPIPDAPARYIRTRGTRIDEAIKITNQKLNHVKRGSAKEKALKLRLKALLAVPSWRKKV